MKPTDEAKRLRDEIESQYMRILHWHDTQQEIRLIEIQALPGVISKVLDVVCMEVNNVGLSAHDTLATKTAINKLRP